MKLSDKEVIVIDDDPSQLLLADKILSNIGVSVTTSSSIEDGIEKIQSIKPHLLLLDIEIGDRLSFEILDSELSNLRKSGTKILMFSAVKNKKIIAKALSYNIDDYIVKPYKSSTLIQKVKKSLLNVKGANSLFDINEIEIDVGITSDLVRFNEYEVVVSGPIKMDKNIPIKNFKSIFFEKVHSEVIRPRISGNSIYKSAGTFESLLTLTGVSDKFVSEVQKIKQARKK